MNEMEFGSDFHYIDSAKWRDASTPVPFFSNEDLSYYYSGRAALFTLINWGIENHGWKCLKVPSYYCHEVIQFIRPLPIDIEYYEITPFKEKSLDFWKHNDHPKMVVLVVDYFGLNKPDYSQFQKSVIIEDLTHNLSAIGKSIAPYAFGSLRKILPVPVGGFCYSKQSIFKDSKRENLDAENAAVSRLTAMYLKKLYLENKFEDKEFFRSLYSSTEEKFGSKFANSSFPNSIKGYLHSLLVSNIIEAKAENLQFAKSKLIKNDYYELKTSKENTDFALTLLFKDRSIRDNLKRYLIKQKIYPIILWPNQFSKANKEFEDKVLFIHIDFRYNLNQIALFIDKINNYFARI